MILQRKNREKIRIRNLIILKWTNVYYPLSFIVVCPKTLVILDF